MRGKARELLPVALALAVAAALSVPLIEVTVQSLGSGEAAVASPVGRAWVAYVFTAPPTRLSAVRIRFDAPLPAGSWIRVELRGDGGAVLASGELTLSAELPAGQWVEVDVEPDLPPPFHSSVAIVVAGPQP